MAGFTGRTSSLIKYNDRSLKDLTTTPAAAGGDTGAIVLIKTLTASSSATLSFVHGADNVVLDSTYPIYKFEFINMHPATNSVYLKVGFRDGGSNYDATKTTTSFVTRHDEADSETSLAYTTSDDLAQSTSAHIITGLIGNGNDETASGEMFLFNPSSTTFVKHFISTANTYDRNDRTTNEYIAGYCNVTDAIDGVQFSMSSGNIDAGKIKLYGIKDS